MFTIIFCFIVALGITLIIRSYSQDNEDATNGWIVFTVFMAFILTALSFNEDFTVRYVPTTVTVAKTPRLTIVDDGERVYEYDLYEDVTNITDSTQFYYIRTTNVFGQEDNEGIVYGDEYKKKKK